ncbi:MAG: signal peptide peptidase SppA [Rhodoferax sp.]|nr:signal peptide peptidase SppA [Rhodoferax sp.]
MSPQFVQSFRALSKGFHKTVDGILRALRVLFVVFVLLYLGGMVWLLLFANKVKVEDHTVLVLALKGNLVEESAGGLREKFLSQMQVKPGGSVRLRDLTQTLELAAKDPRIERVLLKLDDFGGGGLVSLREAASAIERFKASGKPVLAWSASYNQRQYYLAAHASEIVLHPLGAVYVEGFGGQRNYYKDALDKLGIEANLIRVGKYKSAGEPYVLSAPSKQALEAEAYAYDTLWKLYTDGVEKARQLPSGSVTQRINSLPGALQASKGDAAQMAQDWRWVDRLQTFESLRTALGKEVGVNPDTQAFRQVDWRSYLASEQKKVKGEHIAVIVAEGQIGDGRVPIGTIGGLSTADLVREATQDDDVKAIVLRLNSPGGSVLGSELIRDQLRVAREQGKPVVVSMGDVAASGGYWISLAGDTVLADPATITGSIGVFAMLPTAQGLMGKLGIHTGGHRTTWLAGAYDPRQALDPRMRALIQANIDHIYAEFVAKTAQARQMDVSEIDGLAQGRIWTGEQAYQRKLVDRLGDFNDAVLEARNLLAKRGTSGSSTEASLPIRYLGPQVSVLEGVVDRYLPKSHWLLGDARWQWLQALVPGSVSPEVHLGALGEDLLWLQDVLSQSRPFATVAHCMCQMTP